MTSGQRDKSLMEHPDQQGGQTVEEWRAEAIERFGSFEEATFVCPACGNRASVSDFRRFKDKGATPDSAAQKCIGRYDPDVDCDWAAFGLFRSPRVVVVEGDEEIRVFEFAPTS